MDEKTPLKSKSTSTHFVLSVYEEEDRVEGGKTTTSSSSSIATRDDTRHPKTIQMEKRLTLMKKIQLPTKVEQFVEQTLCNMTTMVAVIMSFEVFDYKCTYGLDPDHSLDIAIPAKAISRNQLVVDIKPCREEVFMEIMAILHYLERGRKMPIHTIINKQGVKKKNNCENLFTRYVTTPHVRGYYYEIIVDVLQ